MATDEIHLESTLQSCLRTSLKNMAGPRITIDGLLMTDETDIFVPTSEFSCGDEDSLLTRDEDDDGDEDEIPNAQ